MGSGAAVIAEVSLGAWEMNTSPDQTKTGQFDKWYSKQNKTW